MGPIEKIKMPGEIGRGRFPSIAAMGIGGGSCGRCNWSRGRGTLAEAGLLGAAGADGERQVAQSLFSPAPHHHRELPEPHRGGWLAV
jgi:hypothetical protein